MVAREGNLGESFSVSPRGEQKENVGIELSTIEDDATSAPLGELRHLLLADFTRVRLSIVNFVALERKNSQVYGDLKGWAHIETRSARVARSVT